MDVRRRGTATAFRFLALFGLLLLAAGARAETADGATLLEALRQGGHTVYFRHTATDWGQNDRVEKAGDWTSCDPARMRQLSEQGRAQAAAIGRAIRALGIPVGKVLSSPYCRAVDTAKGLGLGPVGPTPDIMNLRAADYVGGREAAVERARRILATPPAPGTNTVIAAHGNLMRAATGAYTGEGGSVVVRPNPESETGFDFVAELAAEDWRALAARLGK